MNSGRAEPRRSPETGACVRSGFVLTPIGPAPIRPELDKSRTQAYGAAALESLAPFGAGFRLSPSRPSHSVANRLPDTRDDDARQVTALSCGPRALASHQAGQRVAVVAPGDVKWPDARQFEIAPEGAKGFARESSVGL